MRKILGIVAALVIGAFVVAPSAQANTWESGPRPDGAYQAQQYAQIAKMTGRSTAEVTKALSTGDPGCSLSANWYVATSATWSGNDFNYGVLNSPGALLSGGSPDGSRNMFVLFRGGDKTFTGAYHNRDLSKPNSYVYRTEVVSGQTAAQDVTDIYQFPQAPSHIWCPSHRYR